MKLISALKKMKNNGFVAILLMTAGMGIANAALILNVNAGGRLTGAQEVAVNFGAGNVVLYDVSFGDGIYNNIFAATTGVGLFLGTQFAGIVMDACSKEGEFQWSKVWLVPALIVLAGVLALVLVFKNPPPAEGTAQTPPAAETAADGS